VGANAYSFQLVTERATSGIRRLESLKQQAEANNNAMAAVVESLSAVHEEEAASQGQLQQSLEKKAAAEAKVSKLNQQLRTARGHLEEKAVALKQASNKSAMLQALMAETRPGGALEGCGLEGRLGDLGTIHPK
jgi:chromosome segregation ATPase